ncbi:hypothetical protein Cob_v010681 [Colletotrichum orbiculare MAFF 240422]|uniref:Uncharacterized protein n=1 Tax=Colletotrichum orbiculare (strain 104-T / ATCC 96160 / CBS 514.97 / LARS 414 / MAFF 240422) TaxID=1213857 RepID=A0A484FE01_COLOR|nr:hypothetical protein Cob_v010681 [Colletotrichum orbiculare MAFF 240422]
MKTNSQLDKKSFHNLSAFRQKRLGLCLIIDLRPDKMPVQSKINIRPLWIRWIREATPYTPAKPLPEDVFRMQACTTSMVSLSKFCERYIGMAVLNPLFERSSPVRLAKAVIDILMINQYSEWSCMVAHFVHKGYLPTKKEYFASNPKSNARIFLQDEGKVIEIAVDADVEEERWDWTSMPPLKKKFIWDAKIQTLSCWDSIAKETATWEFPQLVKANAAAERELQAGKGSAGGNLVPQKLAIVAPQENEREIQVIS